MKTVQPTNNQGFNSSTQNSANTVVQPAQTAQASPQPVNAPLQMNASATIKGLKKSTKKWVYISTGFSVVAALFGLLIHYALTVTPLDFSQTYLHEEQSYSLQVPEFLKKDENSTKVTFINGDDLARSTAAIYIDTFPNEEFALMSKSQQKSNIDAYARQLDERYESLPQGRKLVSINHDYYSHKNASFALESVVEFEGEASGFYVAHSLFYDDGRLYVLELEALAVEEAPIDGMKKIVNTFKRK